MTPKRKELEAAWRKLDDAKLQLDHAHNYTREVAGDIQSGNVAFAEWEDACRRALRVEQLALANCEKRLSTLREVLLSGRASGAAEPREALPESILLVRKAAADR